MLLIALGTVSVALGVIGIFVPILPTTPFLLLATFFYARSSQHFLMRLLNNRWLGAYIRNYRDGRGIPLRMKVITITGLWATIGLSISMVVASPWIRLALIGVAVAVTVHMLKIRTLPADETCTQPLPLAEPVDAEEV